MDSRLCSKIHFFLKGKRQIKMNACARARKAGVLIMISDKTDFKQKPGEISTVPH
jgi:hypothetical protein